MNSSQTVLMYNMNIIKYISTLCSEGVLVPFGEFRVA